MKKFIITFLLSIILTSASLSPVQGMTLLARDLGFDGNIQIRDIQDNGAQYEPGVIIFDPDFLAKHNAHVIYGYLVHEYTHHQFAVLVDRAVLDNDPVAWFHLLGIVKLPDTGISEYATESHSPTESLSEVAEEIYLGREEHLSFEWLRAYYALVNWYEVNK
jgi:hypothetical protein